MSSKSPIVPLVLAALTAIAVAVGINKLGTETRVDAAEKKAAPIPPRWAATAQGRVEPRHGEIRLGALAPGQITDVLVALNDKVEAGDILVRIDDADALARVLAADAEAGVRKRERDTETNLARLAQDRRNAEDKLNTSERAVATARQALDALLLKRHRDRASVTAAELDAGRTALTTALAQLPADREALRQTQVAVGVPLPTRLEAGLTAARADLAAAEAALERTRVRAPSSGTVLQLSARQGELAAASPEQALVILADLSQLTVRAEVQERDASKVHVGQEVVLKTDAYPDREFTGRVVKVANAMRPPKLAQRGPRRPTDLDALEVEIDVEPGTPMMPGMRVDAYFRITTPKSEPRAEATGSTTTPAVKSN